MNDATEPKNRMGWFICVHGSSNSLFVVSHEIEHYGDPYAPDIISWDWIQPAGSQKEHV